MQEFFNYVVLIIEFLGVGTVVAVLKNFIRMRKEQTQELTLIKEGSKCQIRSELLRVYYHCRDSKTIRQYELENFITLYKAYKALGGNSFIDKIYEEVMEYKVIS